MANPSLAMIPSGYKATKLYSVLPADGVGDFDVTRASTATRVNSSGLIEEVGVNVPRLDYSDGGCPVLLTEPQSTNYYLNSQAMVTQNVTTTASTYTVSFYGTGTLTFTGTYTGSLVGTGANDLVQLTFTATAGSLLSTVSGQVNEAQCEKLSYATSRIRTLGSTVTRNTDVVGGAGDVTTFNSEEGVLYVEISALSNTSPENRYISIGDNSYLNNIQILIQTDGTLKIVNVDKNASSNISDMSSIINPLVYNKIALSYKSGDSKLYVNGVLVDSSVGLFENDAITTISLKHQIQNSNYFYGKTKDIRVFKTALTDAELIELTTI